MGTGGRSLRTFGPPITGLEVRDNSTYGLLRLDLSSTGYTWAFLPGGGAGFTDTGSDLCDPASAPAAEFSDVPGWITDSVNWIADPDNQPPYASGYPDRTYRPAAPITRAQTARALYRIAGSPDVSELPPHRMRDVPAWVDDSIRWLVAHGFATGHPDQTFQPNRDISRGELTRMLHRIEGAPPGARHPFTDVPTWLEPAVDWISDPAHTPSHASGYADGTFRPGLSVTRGQATRMLHRIHT